MASGNEKGKCKVKGCRNEAYAKNECRCHRYKAYQKAYQKTDKYKAYKKAYQKTDKYKAYKKVCNKAYYQRKKLKKVKPSHQDVYSG